MVAKKIEKIIRNEKKRLAIVNFVYRKFFVFSSYYKKLFTL